MKIIPENIKKAASGLRESRQSLKVRPTQMNWEAYLMESPTNLHRLGLETGQMVHHKAVIDVLKRRKEPRQCLKAS